MFPYIYSNDVYDLTFEILPPGIFDTLFDLALVNIRELLASSISPLLYKSVSASDPNLAESEFDSIFSEIEALIKQLRKESTKTSRAAVRFN